MSKESDLVLVNFKITKKLKKQLASDAHGNNRTVTGEIRHIIEQHYKVQNDLRS